MKYVHRPGVVLTKICRQYVLIPNREAYACCKTVLPLPMLWASAWLNVPKENGEELTVKLFSIMTKKDIGQIRNEYRELCEKLAARGFLIEVPEEENGVPQALCD